MTAIVFPSAAEASAAARRLLPLLDLTDLSDACRPTSVDELCHAARERGVAAVCVWPQFVSQAVRNLKGHGVGVATVINFPAGGEDVERAVDDACEALGDGAQEIDLVMPYAAFLRGDHALASGMIAALREVCDRGRVLKVILETGMLASQDRIGAASRLALQAGADFIKTSTGKTPVSATPEAAETMLLAIRDAGRGGLKVSGGVRTLADAAAYLDLADHIMGPGWATPRTFRIGASNLLTALDASIRAAP